MLFRVEIQGIFPTYSLRSHYEFDTKLFRKIFVEVSLMKRDAKILSKIFPKHIKNTSKVLSMIINLV